MTKKITIHHIDVGQGDATFITLRESSTGNVKGKVIESILIDAGPSRNDSARIIRYIESKLATDQFLDAIIVSHGDLDHIGGKDYAGLKNILSSRLYSKIKTKIYAPSHVRIAGYNIATPVPGAKLTSQINLECVSVDLTMFDAQGARVIDTEKRVIDPSKYHIPLGKSNKNATSIATILRFDNFIYYSGGDIEKQSEIFASLWLRMGEKINAFKVSHHASESATPKELLDSCAINSAAIIMTGTNRHRHPRSATLETIESHVNIQSLYTTGILDMYQAVRGEEGANFKYNIDYLNKSPRKLMRSPGAITIRKTQSQNFFTVESEAVIREGSSTVVSEAEYQKIIKAALYKIMSDNKSTIRQHTLQADLDARKISQAIVKIFNTCHPDSWTSEVFLLIIPYFKSILAKKTYGKAGQLLGQDLDLEFMTDDDLSTISEVEDDEDSGVIGSEEITKYSATATPVQRAAWLYRAILRHKIRYDAVDHRMKANTEKWLKTNAQIEKGNMTGKYRMFRQCHTHKIS